MKNILYISPSSSPFDVGYGGAQRSNLLLRACTQVGEVDVICFDDVPEDANLYGARLLYARPVPDEEVRISRFKKIVGLFSAWKIENHYPIQRKKEQIVDGFVYKKHYDFIVTRYISWAVDTGLLKYSDRLVVDVDDSPVESARNGVRLAKTIRNKIYMSFYTLMIDIAMRGFINKVRISFFSNKNDADQYHAIYLPNVPFNEIDVTRLHRKFIKSGRILFVGDMTYAPNFMGIDHFLTYIYPKIESDVQLHIVGRPPLPELIKKWSAYKGVSILGFVDDIVREYAEAEIVIVPIYFGAGTCIKVLEAMQMQRLLITTPVGARGYYDFISPNREFLLANNDEEFIGLLHEALGNDSLQDKLSTNAYVQIERHFSKSAFFNVVNEALHKKKEVY